MKGLINMSLFESIIMGIVQGIAEFLPISSSGHLAIFKAIFNLKEVGLTYDILLHLGTLVAVFVVYWSDIWKLILETLGIIRDGCKNLVYFVQKHATYKEVEYIKI